MTTSMRGPDSRTVPWRAGNALIGASDNLSPVCASALWEQGITGSKTPQMPSAPYRYHFCYLAYHGFSFRMISSSNLLGKLRARGFRVCLVCNDKADPVVTQYAAEHEIDVFEHSPPVGIWTRQYADTRKYYWENIDANPALKEKHIHAMKNGRRIKVPLYIYWHLVNKLGVHIPSLRHRFMRKERRYLCSGPAESLLADICPQNVVSTYPMDITEAQLLHAAAKQGIPTWIHLLSWDNITSKGRFPQLADNYIVWGNVMAQELREYYSIAADKIHTCGVAHFDVHVDVRSARGCSSCLPGLDMTKPYVFFGLSAPRYSPTEIDIVGKLAADVERGVFGNELQLVIRPHPQIVRGQYSSGTWLKKLETIAQTNRRTLVDMPDVVASRMPWNMARDDMQKLATLIGQASVVVNSGSTLIVEALFHDKPAIVCAFDLTPHDYWFSARRLADFLHLRKIIALGGADRTDSYDDLIATIRLYLQDPDRNHALRRRALLEECYLDDGQATERVVNCLIAHSLGGVVSHGQTLRSSRV